MQIVNEDRLPVLQCPSDPFEVSLFIDPPARKSADPIHHTRSGGPLNGPQQQWTQKNAANIKYLDAIAPIQEYRSITPRIKWYGNEMIAKPSCA